MKFEKLDCFADCMSDWRNTFGATSSCGVPSYRRYCPRGSPLMHVATRLNNNVDSLKVRH